MERKGLKMCIENLIITVFLFSQTGLRAQSYDIKQVNYTPQAPQAAQFMRYGEIPVDISTGVPNIEIPIHTIKMRDMEVPISISYHAGGFRNADASSVVGLGWVLNCGGNISRQVLGLPDHKQSTFPFYGGIAEFNNAYDSNDQNYKTNVEDIFALGNIDTQSDRYYYRLNNISGFFRLDMSNHDFTPKPVPYNKVQISYGAGTFNAGANADTYTILDEQGAKYVFDIPEYMYSSSPYFGKHAVLWKPSKIINTNKSDSLLFGYGNYMETRSYAIPNHTFTPSFNYPANPVICNENAPCAFSNGENSSTPETSYTYSPTNNTINYLETVVSNGVRVEFFYETSIEWQQPRRLERIVIKDKNNNVVKKIKFYHSYFGTNSADDGARLKLDSLCFVDAGENSIETYRFQYHPGHLPYRTIETRSFREDYWGFPGLVTRNNLIPQNGSREVNADPNNYNNCMLEKIIYPTGGISQFEFEANNVGNNKYVGGIRIKKITNVSEEGKREVKQYVYSLPNYIHVNEEFFTSASNWYVNNGTYEVKSCSSDHEVIGTSFSYKPCCSGGFFNFMEVLSSNPVYPITNSDGSIVNYCQVEEIIGDGNNWGGKIIYKFENNHWAYDNGTGDVVAEMRILGMEGVSNCHYDRGMHNPLLYQKETYKYENGQYTMVKNEQTDYDKITRGETIYTGLVICKENNLVLLGASTVDMCFFNRVYFRIKHNVKYSDEYSDSKAFQDVVVKRKETITIYNSNGNVVTEKQYFYDNDNVSPTYVKSETTKNSDNRIIETLYKYPYDFRTTEPYASMVSRNVLAPVIEQSENQNNQFTRKIQTVYKNWGNNLFAPEFIKSQTQNQNAPETRITYHNYDPYGNPQYITKDGTEKVVYLWGYKGLYLIAEIKNATFQQVTQAIAEQTLNQIAARDEPVTADWNLINGLRNHSGLSGALVTTYKYKPLVGILTATDPRGIVTTYEYDAFGRLQTVRDGNNKPVESYEYHYKN